MRTSRMLAPGAVLLALIVSACTPGGDGTTSPDQSTIAKPTVVIGSAGFDESELMAEIYAQALEAAGYTVDRNMGIGTREQTVPAITSGQIDLMPEYLGSMLRGGLGGLPTGDSEETAQLLAEAAAEEGLSILDYAPAQDRNAFVVRQETADQYELETLSDLAAVATDLRWGLPSECETNALCAGVAPEDDPDGPREGGLAEYGINFDDLDVEPLGPCDAPVASALNDGVVDVAELCSTQAAIEQFNFVVLEDDLSTQPAENIVPLVRTEFLDAAPADFAETLNAVSAAMTTEILTRLNVEVSVQNRTVADVAAEWLEDEGLI